MTVDMVVQRLGVTPRTLHYYEELGLIPQVRRTSGGHRLYDEATVERIEKILRMKETLGYSLQEIKELMHIDEMLDEQRRHFGESDTQEAREEVLQASARILDELVQRINQKIGRLTLMRDSYQERLTRVQKKLDSPGE